jgi:phenylacetate-CoA ligase
MQQADREFGRISSLSMEKFQQEQESKRWEIFQYHVANNAFYKSLTNNVRIDRWEDIPIIQKNHFQDDLSRMISNPYRLPDLYVANTSGSSGHPFYFAKDKFCHAMTWQLVRERYHSRGITFNDLQGRFYGVPLERRSRLKEEMKDWAMNRIRFPVFDLSEPALKNIFATITKKKVKYLYGYTSSLVEFAKFIIEKGIVLKDECPSLIGCVFTSEMCTTEDRNLLRKSFGIPIIGEYGASELGIIGFDSPSGEMIASDELIYLETKDNDNGQPELLCTSLYNKAFPIIRYRIGDLVELDYRNGRTVIKNILGRTNDLIKLPSGKIAGGLTFYYISRSILEASGALKEFIIRQTALDQFEFDMVVDRRLTVEEEEIIRQKTALYLEKGLTIRMNYVTTVQRPPSGKIKHFYSEVKS